MSDLNKEQAIAALPRPGVDAVIAGAGTGKTATLAAKVKALIHSGTARPENILILTFSRKAADEIKERICDSIGEDAKSIRAGTFHSFCLNFLREESPLFIRTIGYIGFPTVLEEKGKRALIRELIARRIGDFQGLPAGVAAGLLEKLQFLPLGLKSRLHKAGILVHLHELASEFEKRKLDSSLIEFNDMIMHTTRILKENPLVRTEIQRRHRFVLVDEFQDTAEDNFALLKLILPDEGPNLFAVGDDWQSIYGFRNARPGHLLGLQRHYPGTRIHSLRLNYRSRQEIITLSSRFMRRNRFKSKKTLHAVRGKGGEVVFHTVSGFDEENELLGRIIDTSEVKSGSAVLFRNNFHVEAARRQLFGSSVPKGVSMMTMHSSKGLEFGTVIAAGISNSIIPDPDSEIDEERRLLYVAMTRAGNTLHIIAHRRRKGNLPMFASELGMREG